MCYNEMKARQASRRARAGDNMAFACNKTGRFLKAPAAFPGTGRLAPQAEQLRQLQQRLRAVTEERDILKKALAYFADDQK
jgi:transposase-like protein